MYRPIKEMIDRKQILIDYGCTENDVMEDDRGEYILVEPELMDEDENESYDMRKVYLN